jgi:hypothetical protein
MMNEFIQMFSVLLGCGVILAIVIGLGALLFWIMDKCHANKEAKRRAEHPELFKLFEAVHERSTMSCRWYNKEIAPRKRQVDAILKEWNYYTEKTKSEKEQELEELREAIELAKVTENLIDGELRDLRQQVRDYITKHEIKWANGWMD